MTFVELVMSLFDLTRQNTLTSDPVNPFFDVQLGEVRSRGFELEGQANITEGLKALAAFTAYDIEIQRWVDAVRSGVNVDGPTAWDGYAAAAVCEAGVRSLETGERIDVELADRVST